MTIKSKSKKVTIIGDTSKFHLGSKLNYEQFKKLAESKHTIIQEIPYDAFGIKFIEYSDFFDKLKKSKWWKKIKESDILIVHGEGLTEKHDDYIYPYLYFSNISSYLGIESQLVNFSMFEAKPFLDLVKNFDYIATRDILTQKHLFENGIDSELSFDCCILATAIANAQNNSHIAIISGRNTIEDKILNKFRNTVRYDCCWGEEKKKHNSLLEYLDEIKLAKFTLSTSFHGNIVSYLSGIPFISLDDSNLKYKALDIEFLPEEIRSDKEKLMNPKNRQRIYEHYKNIYEKLLKRAKLNIN